MIRKLVQRLPLFRARGRRTLLEVLLLQLIVFVGWLVCGLFLFAAWFELSPRLLLPTFGLGSVAWFVFRWRLHPSTRSRWRQFLAEVEMAGVVLLEMLFCQSIFTTLIHILANFTSPNAGLNILSTQIYVTALGAALLFFLARMTIYIWNYWDRLRRTHLRWSLTHAHLMIVVGGGALISLLLTITSTIATVTGHNDNRGFVPVVFIILPVMLIITGVVLACVLPPSALFSYLFARHTTRRIEKLARATSALRAGDYSVRVDIEGQDEVARLQADFNAMASDFQHTLNELQAERDNVATLLSARRELIASVSHELRTPVATVRSYLESTLSNWQEQPPVMLRQDLYTMEQQTLRLQSLINDLFTLSRAEVKRLDIRCQPSNVELLVQRVVETITPVAWRTSRVEVVADIQQIVSGFPQAFIDEHRLEQVLQNLLHNGIRHTPPGGIIVVSAQVEPDMIVLQVKDTGEGINADELTRIWERFYRTESARQQPGNGTGLGLAIVKELTESMGGKVSVASTLGQGTCFTIRVPRVLPLPTANTATWPIYTQPTKTLREKV